MPDDQTEPLHFDKPVRILLVLAGTEDEVNVQLRAGARARLAASGAQVDEIAVPQVADVPQALALAERLQDFDGHVVLGAVIGAPALWSEVARALTALGMGGGLNGNGLVAADSRAAALQAADPARADAGGVAAQSVLALIALSRRWAANTKGIGFRA